MPSYFFRTSGLKLDSGPSTLRHLRFKFRCLAPHSGFFHSCTAGRLFCSLGPLPCSPGPLPCSPEPLPCAPEPVPCSPEPLPCTPEPLLAARNHFLQTRDPFFAATEPIPCGKCINGSACNVGIFTQEDCFRCIFRVRSLTPAFSGRRCRGCASCDQLCRWGAAVRRGVLCRAACPGPRSCRLKASQDVPLQRFVRFWSAYLQQIRRLLVSARHLEIQI